MDFDGICPHVWSYLSHPVEELHLVFFIDVVGDDHLSRSEHALTLECTAYIALLVNDKNLIFVLFRAFLVLGTQVIEQADLAIFVNLA